MNPEAIQRAARTLWNAWQSSTRIAALPATDRPADEQEGFEVQKAITALSGDRRFGWKIAATSPAGQQHIGVSGPLPGSLLASRVKPMPSTFATAGNSMQVAEAEFAFRMARTLPPRARPYEVDEVMAAVGTLHPAIEIPDSRYETFVTAGGPQLIADNACACWFTVASATGANWRETDLSRHPVSVTVNGRHVADGTGANVLGDPRLALTWLANALSRLGTPLAEGETVTTGTCVVPVKVAAGDHVVADFGPFGRAEARFE